MKKILILSVLFIFTLSSFNSKEVKAKNVLPTTWNYKCRDGSSGQIYCPSGCSYSEALSIANHICSNQFPG
ncbi:hypothetical protein [Flavobacterium sp.]|uniref:hypothetical protein n=1 Tax=Flavobacterium sp. TaxID=239 RepID=UPI00375279A8